MRKPAKNVTLTEIIDAWVMTGHNIKQAARALDVNNSLVRNRLIKAGIHVPNENAKGRPVTEIDSDFVYPVEVIRGMTYDAIREKFKLAEGVKVWVEKDGKAINKVIKAVHKRNIETTNKYGRVECFTYGDILTGYYLSQKGERKRVR